MIVHLVIVGGSRILTSVGWIVWNIRLISRHLLLPQHHPFASVSLSFHFLFILQLSLTSFSSWPQLSLYSLSHEVCYIVRHPQIYWWKTRTVWLSLPILRSRNSDRESREDLSPGAAVLPVVSWLGMSHASTWKSSMVRPFMIPLGSCLVPCASCWLCSQFFSMYSHDLSSPNSVSIGSVYEISPAGVARLLTWQLRAPRATKAIAARAAALLVKAGVWLDSDSKEGDYTRTPLAVTKGNAPKCTSGVMGAFQLPLGPTIMCMYIRTFDKSWDPYLMISAQMQK